jgi:hypothetical protein
MPDTTQIQTLLARLHTALDAIEHTQSILGDALSTIAEQADALHTDAQALAALTEQDTPDVAFEALCDLTEEFERMRNALDTQLLDVHAAIREIEDETARHD